MDLRLTDLVERLRRYATEDSLRPEVAEACSAAAAKIENLHSQAEVSHGFAKDTEGRYQKMKAELLQQIDATRSCPNCNEIFTPNDDTQQRAIDLLKSSGVRFKDKL